MDGPLVDKIMNEADAKSVLGLSWRHRDDVFQFKVEKRAQPPKTTKRTITSEAARIYDPQGFLSPVTIRAKFFIQSLWTSKLEWDDELPAMPLPSEPNVIQIPAASDWLKYYESLGILNKIRIPRWIGTAPDRVSQFHGFVDASAKAYGAVCYIRTQANGKWNSTQNGYLNIYFPIEVSLYKIREGVYV